MTSLLARLRGTTEQRSGWLTGGPQLGSFLPTPNSALIGSQTYHIGAAADPDTAFVSLVQRVHQAHGVVAACVFVRQLLLSQTQFAFRNIVRADENYRQLFGASALAPLEGSPEVSRPELLATAEAHASYHGNAYITIGNGAARCLLPHLVDVVMAGPDDPVEAANHHRVVGYLFYPWGREYRDRSGEPVFETLLPGEVAHWKPELDPVAPWRGASWVTSVLAEISNDFSATHYLRQFFNKAATPNMIVRPSPALAPEKVKEFKELFADAHEGVDNAFRTLWLGGGSDVTIVGSKLSDLDLKDLQGGNETRIAARSRVPAVILGIREGLQGSSLNAGNYSAARRSLADLWYTPTVQGLCAKLETLVPAPTGAELWYDPSDVLFLQEDAKDAADIAFTQAQAIRQLVEAGFRPADAVKAVRDGNLAALEKEGAHTGLTSVQLVPPGTGEGGASDPSARVLSLVEQIQKIYLGVDKVITADEARLILNEAGANLDIPGPFTGDIQP